MAKRVYNRRVDPEVEALKLKVGERIRNLRLEMNINQDDFARKANIHRAHVGKLENGEVDPTLGTLYKVAKALKVDVGRLVAKELKN